MNSELKWLTGCLTRHGFHSRHSSVRRNKRQGLMSQGPPFLAWFRHSWSMTWALYKDKPWDDIPQVAAAMVSTVDRHVGEILTLLKTLGIDQRTIAFFTSDKRGRQTVLRGSQLVRRDERAQGHVERGRHSRADDRATSPSKSAISWPQPGSPPAASRTTAGTQPPEDRRKRRPSVDSIRSGLVGAR